MSQQVARKGLRGLIHNARYGNVGASNPENRPGDMDKIENFTFLKTLNMGYEGFGTAPPLYRMHANTGNRGEFLALFGLVSGVWLIKSGRKRKEERLRAIPNVASNAYRELNLSKSICKPTEL